MNALVSALIIAVNGVRLTFRSREAVFWIFIGPMLMATFFGILFKPQPPSKTRIDVVNLDTSDEIATAISDSLAKDDIDVRRVPRVAGERTTLVIPAGAAAAMAAGKPLDLRVHAGPEETRAEANLRFKIFKGAVSSALGVKSTDPAGPLVIVNADLGLRPREITAGFQRSVPSYMVMFVFLNLLVSGAGIAEERKLGLLRRLGMAPIPRHAIVLGKLLGRFFIGWIQIVWMLTAGIVVFKIQWAHHGWTLFAFLTVFALACASLGMFFGTLFRDPDKCRALAVWTAILLAPLGGLWWPIEIVSPTLKRVSHLVPTGWAMEPINAMLAFDAGAGEALPFAAAFLALFAVTFVIASRRLETV
jgi:ABC-type polysaccharide/polyol phosphate export permease